MGAKGGRELVIASQSPCPGPSRHTSQTASAMSPATQRASPHSSPWPSASPSLRPPGARHLCRGTRATDPSSSPSLPPDNDAGAPEKDMGEGEGSYDMF
jgi:hypothetical protein